MQVKIKSNTIKSKTNARHSRELSFLLMVLCLCVTNYEQTVVFLRDKLVFLDVFIPWNICTVYKSRICKRRKNEWQRCIQNPVESSQWSFCKKNVISDIRVGSKYASEKPLFLNRWKYITEKKYCSHDYIIIIIY